MLTVRNIVLALMLSITCIMGAQAAQFNSNSAALANVSTTYSATATSIVLNSGQGATKVPTVPTVAYWYNTTDYATPTDDPFSEIVGVTALATDTLTLIRGQCGTVASAKNIGGKSYNLMFVTAGQPSAQVLQQTGVPHSIYPPAQTNIISATLASDQPFTDSSGNNYLAFVKTASAVDAFTITNGATGNPAVVKLSGTGTDTNIGLTFAGKGSGPILLGQATASGVQLVADQPIQDSSGNNYLAFTKTGTAVDGFTITNAAAASPGLPIFQSTGSDSNIHMILAAKGTGTVQVNLGGAGTPGTTTNNGGVWAVPSHQVSINGIGNGADTTDDVLFTYTLPANALKNTGQCVRVKAWGTTAANGNNKTVKLWFGSVAFVTTGVVTTNNGTWHQAMTVIKSGSSTQMVMQERNWVGTTAADDIAPVGPTAGSQTDTSAITIKVTGASGTSGTASDVLGMGFLVEFGE